jgi:hypothetical protein
MKKILLSILATVFFISLFAQDEKKEPRKGQFKKENLYIGGGLNIGAGSGMFAIGIIPEVGYSLTNWLDVGIPVNLNYQTQRLQDFNGAVYAKYRAFNYGTGMYLRIWPVNFLHVTVQPEYNWIKLTEIDVFSNQKQSYTYKAESFLVGIGYGNREVGKHFSYFTVMIDLAKNINSPYRDQYNHAKPFFRTGVGFYLWRH